MKLNCFSYSLVLWNVDWHLFSSIARIEAKTSSSLKEHHYTEYKLIMSGGLKRRHHEGGGDIPFNKKLRRE